MIANAARHGSYGINGQYFSYGNAILNGFYPGRGVRSRTISPGRSARAVSAPARSSTSLFEDQFVDIAAGDYTVRDGQHPQGCGAGWHRHRRGLPDADGRGQGRADRGRAADPRAITTSGAAGARLHVVLQLPRAARSPTRRLPAPRPSRHAHGPSVMAPTRERRHRHHRRRGRTLRTRPRDGSLSIEDSHGHSPRPPTAG